MTALLLWGGIVGALLFVTVFTVDGATRPGYRPRRHPVSALALGPRGWVQASNFVVSGLLLLLGAVGVRLALADLGIGGLSGWLVPLLLLLLAVGMALSGVYPMDPMRDYPPPDRLAGDLPVAEDDPEPAAGDGSVAPAGGGEAVPTRTHQIHDQLGSVVFLAMPALAFAGAALLFGRPAGLVLAPVGLVVGVALLVLLGRFAREWEADGDASGLVQRTMILLGLGWIVAVLAYLL